MRKISLVLLGLLFSIATYAQITLILQPGPSEGKDADIRDDYPTTPNPGSPDFISNAWTGGGHSFLQRSLIQFDLSSIPPGSVISSAIMSLYANPTTGHGQHSSPLSGSNECYFKRIITPWEEYTVNWNNKPQTTEANKVTIPQSTTPLQDYPNIDVTQLIQDMVNYPSTSFGMMFMLKTEVKYRSMIFSSSDNANYSLHPKIVITYTSPCQTITGNVSYSNAASTLLNGLKVFAINSNNVKTDSTITNGNGDFSLEICNPGTYSIRPQGVAQDRGINSYDALIAMKYFVGLQTLDELFLKAADVDNNGTVNSHDGELIVHRFIGRIRTFPAGDWVFDTPSVTIPAAGSPYFVIKGLCIGDLNASCYQ